MSVHIENVKKALEFNKPDYLPMETNNVPGIYNAYHTLDPSTVELIPGTENFDAIWPQCYSWVPKVIGTNEQGEPLRKDQFGIVTSDLPKVLTFVVLNPTSSSVPSIVSIITQS